MQGAFLHISVYAVDVRKEMYSLLKQERIYLKTNVNKCELNEKKSLTRD